MHMGDGGVSVIGTVTTTCSEHICHRDMLILENWKRGYVLLWVALVSYHDLCIIASAVKGKV